MKNRKKILLFGIILFTIGLIYIAFLQYKITQFSQNEVPKNADYVIILGARVKSKVPSLVLKARITAAADYLKENPDTIAIASGGKGPGEDIAEAESIKEGLIHLGINESRIILEDRSTNTNENVKFSKKLIPKNATVGIIVTNNFHLYRSISIAHDQGLNLLGLAAKTPKSAILKSYSREYLAITKYYFMRLVQS